MEHAVADSDALLICENVTRRFGSLLAVDNMSVRVAKGEVLGIGGPNGAGKTTFFDVITGMTPASSGRIVFDGRDVTHMRADRLCQLGMARTFQLNAAFEQMSCLENVEVAAYYGRTLRLFPGLRMGRAARTAANDALAFVGLADKAGKRVAELSVLDRKLLMIAGALATQARIVFLDEPAGGLAVAEIDLVIELVQQMRAHGLTIVLIEHVMRFLLTLSERVLIMHHGSLLFEGSPAQLAEDERVVEVYLGQSTRARLKQHFVPPAQAHP